MDGRKNAKIQSIKFNQFPIYQAHFTADGEEFLASSEMSGNIQVHNLVTGKSKIIPHNKEMEPGSYKVSAFFFNAIAPKHSYFNFTTVTGIELRDVAGWETHSISRPVWIHPFNECQI